MHMYRVIQTSPLGAESIIALHGTFSEASAQTVRLDPDLSPELAGFTYTADADPVEVTVTSID